MSIIHETDLKQFLEEKYFQYNNLKFIDTDPIQIPHQFNNKHDIEISAFLTAIISWGQRKSILEKGYQLFKRMGNNPYDYLMNAGENHFESLNSFVYRTFNGIDCVYFMQSLRNIYLHHKSLEHVFYTGYSTNKSIYNALKYFRQVFFEIEGPLRTSKHIADVTKNAGAKRLNMFLRWMVRKDSHGVDFGLWNNISPAHLQIPLDIHTGNVARKLGLLSHKQNNWKAVEDLTQKLCKFDPQDPVKYDFALFGLGIFENF